MKKIRRPPPLPGYSRRRWAKRGRAVADFIGGLLFSFAESFVDFLTRSVIKGGRGLLSLVSRIRSWYRQRKETDHMTRKLCAAPGTVQVVQNEPAFRPVDRTIIQTVRFRDIIGLTGPKNEISRAMLPAVYREKAGMLKIVAGGGILLVGPGGNGKSLLAKATANEVGDDVAVFEVTPADIIRRTQQDSLDRVRELFRVVRGYPQVVIVINEVEGIVRESSSPIIQAVNAQLLTETSGFLGESERTNRMLLLIAMTNKPELMRPEAKRTGRFGGQIFVGLPGLEDRRELFERSMRDVPSTGEINYSALAAKTRFCSCADIADERGGVVAKAKRVALQRSTVLKGNAVSPVCMLDFTEVLFDFRPSIPVADLRRWYPDGQLGQLT